MKSWNRKKHFTYSKRFISVFIVISIIFSASPIWALPEMPAKIYTGITNADSIINNISFKDIGAMPANYWAKDAIYEIGALEAIKGYGDQNFRPNTTLSKEEAIALIYRMLGQEAAAQKAAEALNAVRGSNQKKTSAISMWADGYLQLAVNDGLITRAEFQTAMQRFQPKPGTKNKFVRADKAQRQEVAYWAAKALRLAPVYGQQTIFNSYNDWSKSTPEKVPYIEAILKEKIMNGKSKALFDPLGSVRRDEMAQLLMNMEDKAFALRLLEKKKGKVEAIFRDINQNQTDGLTKVVIAVRGEDGKLYNIEIETPDNQTSTKKQEFSPGNSLYSEKELIVYRDGVLGKSGLIQQDDSLSYIVNLAGEAIYVKAEHGDASQDNIDATVKAVDTVNRKITVLDENGNTLTYSIRTNAVVTEDGNKIDLSKITSGVFANMTLLNNQVSQIEINFSNAGEAAKDIAGIVEDNNPPLKYISLYDENGNGSNSNLRVYNYNPDTIQVQRNGSDAKISDIQHGDTVHIGLDKNGNVEKISGADNYESIYGKILSLGTGSIAVQYNDGTEQVLPIDDNVVVISDKQVSDFDSLKTGDYIRILIQKTPSMTKVKEITTQTYTQDISNVYKAVMTDIDTLTSRITLKNVQKLYKGDWTRVDNVGFLVLPIDDKVRIFDSSKELNIDEAKELYSGKEVYVAAKKSYGDQEIAQMLSFRNNENAEVVYDDTISSVSTTGSLKLEDESSNLEYNDGTIVVKDGRLVTGRSLSGSEDVYVAANRSAGSNTLEAGVILSVDNTNLDTLQIVRGKLSGINTNKDLTLETFSVLDGLVWKYNGFQKTYTIDFNTRIIGNAGVISTRDFNEYADANYIGTSIYVVANETKALLISTAPFGAYNVKGKVVSADSSTITIGNSSIYDNTVGDWTDKGTIKLTAISNTIVIKNGKMASIGDIQTGDIVRILKKDDTTTGDAYLIMVEK